MKVWPEQWRQTSVKTCYLWILIGYRKTLQLQYLTIGGPTFPSRWLYTIGLTIRKERLTTSYTRSSNLKDSNIWLTDGFCHLNTKGKGVVKIIPYQVYFLGAGLKSQDCTGTKQQTCILRAGVYAITDPTKEIETEDTVDKTLRFFQIG